MCVFFVSIWGLHAQYDASPSFYTPYYDEARPVSQRPIKRTACDMIADGDRKKKYAIVGLNYHGSTYCERYVTLGVKDGATHTIIARSAEEISWDHSGITKVLFDPRNPNVFYVLYQETLRHHDTGDLYNPSDRRTYLKRFTYNGTSTLIESNRLQIFNYANGADFVIAPNGIILVCGVNSGGEIKGAIVSNMSILISGMSLSDDGEAKISNHLQGISMDIKGTKVVLGHSVKSATSGTKMRIVRYDIGGIYPSLISERFIEGHRMRVDAHTPKTVAIRENGDAFYLNWNFTPGSPDKFDLVKLAEGSSVPTYIFTEAPSAEDLVISQNDKIYVGGTVDGEHAIGLFNEFDTFEHLYDVDSDLDNPLHDLAVDDCTILASGHKFTGSHYRPSHQTFSCTDCDSSPHADFEFTNSPGGLMMLTPYGPKYVPGYCSKYDIRIDGSASKCESEFWISLSRINTLTWSFVGPPVIPWTGISGPVPNNFALADYLPAGFEFESHEKFLLTLWVGNGGVPVDVERRLFRVTPLYCGSGRFANPSTELEVMEKDINVYPNPSTGIFYVENSDASNETTYTVKDLNGRTVKEFIGKGSVQMDLEGNPSGVYFLHIEGEEKETVKKIVLQ